MIDPREADPREAKLAVWAQDRFAELRQRLREAEAARDAARLATDPAGSRAVLEPRAVVPIGLGPHPLVRFPLDTDAPDHFGRYVEVMAFGNQPGQPGPRRLYVRGSGGLIVRPDVSNTIYVEVDQ